VVESSVVEEVDSLRHWLDNPRGVGLGVLLWCAFNLPETTGFAMTDFSCPECKDTGEYRGLNTVEPCRACGGKKPSLATNPLYRHFLPEVLSGQSVRHEIEEQIAGPIEVVFPIESMDQFELDIDWNMGKSKRTPDGLEMELIVNSIICNLKDIPQERSRYAEYKQLIQGRTPFTAVFQNGEDANKKENVTMLACQPRGQAMNFTLEWKPDDA
jgi:hypothetical protein